MPPPLQQPQQQFQLIFLIVLRLLIWPISKQLGRLLLETFSQIISEPVAQIKARLLGTLSFRWPRELLLTLPAGPVDLPFDLPPLELGVRPISKPKRGPSSQLRFFQLP